MELIGCDLETMPFCAGNLAPRIICATFATQRPDGSIETSIFGNGDPGLEQILATVFTAPYVSVWHNGGNYDLACVMANYPHLTTLIFQALAEGRVRDTLLCEKLLNLSITGNLEYETLPDGTNLHLGYALADLELRYFGRDRSAEKHDDDAWRQHFKMLDGRPAAQYPPEAADYAMKDAEGALRVYLAQLQRAKDEGGSLTTEEFQVGVQHCLRLITCWGIAADADEHARILGELAEELKPERMRKLIEHQILWPVGSKRPQKRKKKDGTYTVGLKTVKKEETSRINLHALVVQVCEENGLEIPRKPPTEKMVDEGIEEGNISADENVLEEIAHLHPALEEYQHRQYLYKLVNTDLPRMLNPCETCGGTGKMQGAKCWPCLGSGRQKTVAPVIHGGYGALVATGRTHSYAPEDANYASQNMQNLSTVKKLTDAAGNERGEVNIRHCYVARGYVEALKEYRIPPKVLCSVDIQALEFCSMGHVCYTLFGHSVMRDLINAGQDPHAYLGSQIALAQHREFADLCRQRRIAGDAMEVYAVFKGCEEHEDADLRAFYKQYRKLAKPVGFGFPGGLGIKKFVGFAKAHPYNVRVTEEQARELKAIWFEAFPEMQEFFRWVDRQKDPRDPSLHTFTTPFGMVRALALYTAMCNAALLQAPSAEGAKLATWDVVRACYDPSMNSILLGQHTVAMVHDELVVELDNDDLRHERAYEVARLMTEAVGHVLSTVTIRAKPALMYRLDKEAKTVLDANGRLAVWEPETKAAATAAA